MTGCPVPPLASAGHDIVLRWLAEVRRTTPVCYVEQLDAWVVARHEDVLRVLRDQTAFGSAVRELVLAKPAAAARELLAGSVTFTAANMAFDDGADHERLRRPWAKEFSVHGVAKHEDALRAAADGLLGDLPGPVADLVSGYARPLALRAIMAVVGLPGGDYDIVARGAGAVHSFLYGIRTPDQQLRDARAVLEWEDYLASFIRSRRSFDAPGYDDAELIALISCDLLGAGARSAAFALPNLCAQLLEDRQRWEALRAEPESFDRVFAESLRRRGLGMGMFRRSTRDVVLSGVTVPAGALVWALASSADHDEDQFTDPETFDPARPNLARSAVFGHGTHFCIGRNLAASITRVGVDRLMRRCPGLRPVCGQEFAFDPSYNTMVLTRLLVDLAC